MNSRLTGSTVNLVRHMISHNGNIAWLARSPDLSACDFFFWGYLKKVHANKPPYTLRQLIASISNEALSKVFDSSAVRLEEWPPKRRYL